MSRHLRTPARAKATPRELKQERASRTRRQLLDAAATAFAEKGFPAVTLQDIADLAEVTKGAVYFHFMNKEAVAVAVTEEFYTQLPTIGESVTARQLPPLDAVAELLLQTAVALRDNPVMQAGARLQIERNMVNADMPTPFSEFTQLITELLAQAQDEGTLRATPDVAPMARVVVAAFFGSQHISWVQHNREDLTDRVQEIIDVVLPHHT
ncbi:MULTISPECIES: ScbR family autoregulator-binding transcription factor [unclassified Streptomyces]|uniref:ScbR family autoregulator-binding transcription factor n=1 Tax=unclassified Streptomyces TaxID=2593676 RepID=UPI0022575024|nr:MULTISPECIES: ScbR family autoregulator-binding transcription factor [unclassified Streptomyces]MCX5328811.1 ScbR family autoregulator-binding transcription factor [Streptomyces sp. NBC_00140]MCX5358221.1 ScbR family autoregulator-binding transcription factor [Streptomyces sp. NBC_00124]